MLFNPSALASFALIASFSSVYASESVTMEKRQSSVNAGTLCGIGLLNYCGASAPGINTLNDALNCGAPGNICPTGVPNSAGAPGCVNGGCVAQCNPGFTYAPGSATCINDANYANVGACGSANTVCHVANGSPQCVAGTCSAFTCQSGFTLVQGVCQSTSTLNDAQNCGAVGYACPAISGASTSTCTNGVCVIKGCSQGYALNLNSCEEIDLSNDPLNCGAYGMNCGAGALCQASVCTAVNCKQGFVYNPAINSCADITSDTKNCGAIGNTCQTSSNAVTNCVNSKCSSAICPSPYYVVSKNACVLAPSQAASRKRSKITKRKTLCPGDETACPIVGSASFLLAQSQGFSLFKNSDLSALGSVGGYECLDTKYSIESCGGCSSMGDQDTGVNCLELPHSSGVGCSAGTCIVFSCQAGYRPNLTGTGCVQSTQARRKRSASENVKRSVSHVARSFSHSSH